MVKTADMDERPPIVSNRAFLTIEEAAALLRVDRAALASRLARGGEVPTLTEEATAPVDGDALWACLDPEATRLPPRLIEAVRADMPQPAATVTGCTPPGGQTRSKRPRSSPECSSLASATAGHTLRA